MKNIIIFLCAFALVGISSGEDNSTPLDNETIAYIRGVFAGQEIAICIDCESELGITIFLEQYCLNDISRYGYEMYSAALNCERIIEHYPGRFGSVSIVAMIGDKAVSEMQMWRRD